jgi:hypothetical protein
MPLRTNSNFVAGLIGAPIRNNAQVNKPHISPMRHSQPPPDLPPLSNPIQNSVESGAR